MTTVFLAEQLVPRRMVAIKILHRQLAHSAEQVRRFRDEAAVAGRLRGAHWMLLRALGTDAPLAGTFASFMIASLARTVSIVPGGLGVFEAVAVLTLHQIGTPLAAALSATLLFRGVSYWLPMIPGFVASRRLR